jgi:ring-1,2-phenylacetyl-CoA epoxidase subunit PaaD
VTDPEIPVITIEDLGILRDVQVEGGRVVVTITPTYSGCPAMQRSRPTCTRSRAPRLARRRGAHGALPAWTTDWMSEDGRRKLREFGIAPPSVRATGPVPVQLGRLPLAVSCPQCGSADTEELTRFSSTSCKAMWRCLSCREPFDHFKAH